jgi:hypothetical protein
MRSCKAAAVPASCGKEDTVAKSLNYGPLLRRKVVPDRPDPVHFPLALQRASIIKAGGHLFQHTYIVAFIRE